MKWLLLLTTLILVNCIPDDEAADLTLDLEEVPVAGFGLAETTWEEGEGMEFEAFDHRCGNGILTGDVKDMYKGFVCWSGDHRRFRKVPNKQVCADRCLRNPGFKKAKFHFIEYNAKAKLCDCDKANQAQDRKGRCRRGRRRKAWDSFSIDNIRGSACGRNRCCSKWKWCGGSGAYCNTGNHERSDHRCGPKYGGAICNGKRCCSRWGWCGGSRDGKWDAWCRSKLSFLNHVAGFADNIEDVSLVFTSGFAAVIAIPALIGFQLYKKRQESATEYDALLADV